MSSGFVYLRPITVVASRVCGPYAQGAVEAWRQMFAWIDDSGLRSQIGVGYGLLRDNPAEIPREKCRYDACVALEPGFENMVPLGFSVQRLPGGAYARQRHLGVEGLHAAIAELRDSWVPSHGLHVVPGRPFIEIYLDDPTRVPAAKRRVDICIPVSTAAQASHRSAA
ncbi:MAG: AraC family transcriptional regulator [Hyphomicrobium sp.]